MQVLGGLGIVVVIVVAIVAIMILNFIHKLKGALGEFAKMAEGADSASPPRIHIKAAPEDGWQDPSTLLDNKQKAKRLGYNDLGTFSIDEMPGVIFNALVKPDESSYCIIYQHPQAGVWFDFVTKYDDNTGLTVSNAPMGGELDHRPGQKKVYLKNVDLSDLYSRMVVERDKTNLFKLSGSGEEFVAVFEKAYADEMDWRNGRGGASADEIRRVAQQSGMEVTDTMVKMAEAIKNQQSNEGLVVAFEERLKAAGDYGENEWQELRSRLIFIHDRLAFETLRDVLSQYSEEIALELPEGTSPRQFFRTFVENNRIALERLATLEDPIETDVYAVSSSRKVEI